MNGYLRKPIKRRDLLRELRQRAGSSAPLRSSEATLGIPPGAAAAPPS
jgi:hypothetical protein